MTRDYLRAGVVGSPHGLDGSFHVVQPSPSLLSVGTLVLIEERQRRIVRRAGTDARPIVRLDEVEDRGGAEQLRGAELLVQRSAAPQLEGDEWWPEDLEGCAVVAGGGSVGTVRRLLALPSCEVLEVERGDGGELLVPLIADAVLSVDVDARRIEVDLEFLGES